MVTGFEPVDLMAGILICVQALEKGEANVENAYRRSAHTAGTANRYWYGGLTDASWPLLRWNEEASEGFWPWLPF